VEQVAVVHLAANTEGNIVPSVAEYVLVQAVADGSLRHSLTTSRSEVSVAQVVESHFAASTLGRALLPP